MLWHPCEFDPRVKPERGTCELDRDHPLAVGLYDLVPFWDGGGGLAENLAHHKPAVAASSPTWGMTPGGMAARCNGGSFDIPDHGNLVAGDFAVRAIVVPVAWPNGYTALIDKGVGGATRELSVFFKAGGNYTANSIGGTFDDVDVAGASGALGAVMDFVLCRRGTTVTAYTGGVARGNAGASSSTTGYGVATSLGRNTSGGGGNANAFYLLYQAWKGRAPTPDQIAWLAAEPHAMLRPVVRRVYSIPAGGGVTGALAVTLGVMALAATGASVIAGSLSQTLGALTVAATGTAPIAGTVATTIGALTVAATAVSPIAGALSQTLGALTVAATGVAPVVGSLAQTLGTLTVAATGGAETFGTLSVTLGALTVLAAGAALVRGTLGVVLGALTVAATGTATGDDTTVHRLRIRVGSAHRLTLRVET